jgi:hypothetical protein
VLHLIWLFLNLIRLPGDSSYTMNSKPAYSNTVTVVNCGGVVGGVVSPTNKLEILTPYPALGEFVASVSAAGLAKKRRD